MADDDDSRDRLLGETIGSAIVDSGCSRTVCGDLWLNTYIDSLSQHDRMSVSGLAMVWCIKVTELYICPCILDLQVPH